MCFLALNCSAQFNEHIEDLQGEHTFCLVMVAEERGETDKGCHHHQFSAAPWEIPAVREGTCAQQAAKSWFEPWICHSVAEWPWTCHSSLSFLICKLRIRVFFSTHKIYNVWSESCSDVSDFLRPHGLYSRWNSPGQNTGVGSLSLLQGIFPTQGSNPDLLHCRQILYQLSQQGSPRILEWVAYPFFNGSSWPRNWARVSSIAGGFFTSWATREAHIMSGTWQKFNRQLILPYVIIPAVSTVPQLWEAREWSGNKGGLLRWVFMKSWILKHVLKERKLYIERKERPIVGMKVACGRQDVAVVQSLSHVWLLVTPWTAARQAPMSVTISQSLLKFMSIEVAMLSNHLVLCCSLLLLPSISPNIRVFCNKSALCIRWPKY